MIRKMVRKDLLIHKTQMLLGEFLAPMLEVVDRPRERFLQQVIRRMPYVNLVRDGSEDKLVMGYWCIEVYAHLPHKHLIPLALDVYGIDDPAVGSENLQIQRVVTAVHRDLQGRGVWSDSASAVMKRFAVWSCWRCWPWVF